MNPPEPTLIEPTEDLRPEFLEMAEEYLHGGDPRYQSAIEDFSGYLHGLAFDASGVGLLPGRVPGHTYWLAVGRRPIGWSSIRLYLTTDLENEGGNIGYDIRPSGRQKGYGKLILSLTLAEARRLGLIRVLLTCDTDNIASARIIEANSGRLKDQVVSRRSGNLVSRYWIEL